MAARFARNGLERFAWLLGQQTNGLPVGYSGAIHKLDVIERQILMFESAPRSIDQLGVTHRFADKRRSL
jgi:hypothetical protein